MEASARGSGIIVGFYIYSTLNHRYVVDSISRDGPDTPYTLYMIHYCNKYPNISKQVTYEISKRQNQNLQQIIYQDYSSKQLYMPEPDIQKNSQSSFFLSFFFIRPSQLNNYYCLFGVDRPTQILHDTRKFLNYINDIITVIT